ncbi:hypothetical protein B0H12DRAFT_1080661 [Mycena haematopus]|nr:hypothetical protein B0H12DRAFT_1080661 [Mycena haematopus]
MAPRILTTAERNAASADRATRHAKRASSAPLPDVPPAPLPPTGSASLVAIPEHDTTPRTTPPPRSSLKPAHSTPASTSSSAPISAAVVEAAFRKVSAPKPLNLRAPAEQVPSRQAPTKPTLAADTQAAATSTNESTPDAAVPPLAVHSPGGGVPAAPAAPAIVDGGVSTVHGSEATPIDVDTPTTPTMPANSGNGIITANRTTPDGFPALPAPSPNIQSHAALRKEKKDKGKGKALGVFFSQQEAEEERDPILAAHIAQAKVNSLAHTSTTPPDNGSSSSRRTLDLTPGSPPKRQRSNTAGDAVPPARLPSPSTTRTDIPRLPESTARTGHHPSFRTADGNPPRGSYTPIPENDWRPLYGIEGESIWRNHPEAQREMWDREPHPKFLAIVSGGNGDRTLTQRAIATAIANFVNVDVDEVSVGPPALGTGSGNDARAWLIGGLPANLAQAVLDAQVLCCTEITLFLVQYRPPINGFLGAITGFTIRNNSAGANKACQRIAHAMRDDPAISRFVRSHRDVFPPHIGEDEALDLFILSVGVRGIDLLLPGNAGTYVTWNVYVMTPTDVVKDFNELRRLFSLLVIVTSFDGEGRIHPPVSCNLCPCNDHPTPVCPYPSTSGWLGATTTNISTLLEISRAARARALGTSATGNGGSRGRGGGRGGRGKARYHLLREDAYTGEEDTYLSDSRGSAGLPANRGPDDGDGEIGDGNLSRTGEPVQNSVSNSNNDGARDVDGNQSGLTAGVRRSERIAVRRSNLVSRNPSGLSTPGRHPRPTGNQVRESNLRTALRQRRNPPVAAAHKSQTPDEHPPPGNQGRDQVSSARQAPPDGE